MSCIDAVFAEKGHKALIPYVTVGYPSLEATLKVVPLLAENGCDMVELGIPFSDPLADGATIQKASTQALHNGVTPKQCLEVAGQLSAIVNIPLLFMTYYNPVFSFGIDGFCAACKMSGISGLIIPDLPPEEGSQITAAAGKQGMDVIYLVAPTSDGERIKLVAEKSGGFIYVVSVTGVTGVRQDISGDLETFLNRVRQVTHLPLSVGFGISTPEQASRVSRIADGVIVGSRIIQLMEEDESLGKVAEYVRGLRRAIDGA